MLTPRPDAFLSPERRIFRVPVLRPHGRETPQRREQRIHGAGEGLGIVGARPPRSAECAHWLWPAAGAGGGEMKVATPGPGLSEAARFRVVRAGLLRPGGLATYIAHPAEATAPLRLLSALWICGNTL